jgi:formate-dependent phosphoribosylglycinamide formyltransferase (GAR transformylase)
VATERWHPTARMAMAFRNAGCDVEMLCPSGHPVSKTQAANRLHDYNGLMPLMSLNRAIDAADPDLIVPADDLATNHLHELYRRKQKTAKGGELCNLIERSLGAAGSFEVVRARSTFMQIAREEGIRAPRTEVIAGHNDLVNWIEQTGFPFVLKANGTSGGIGVKVVDTADEAAYAFRALQSAPMFARAIKHALVDRDLTLLWPSLSRQLHVVNVQEFVHGHEATSAIACWKGEVLASLNFEVIEKARSKGHATVVRRIDHPEMSLAAKKIARRLELSGLHGLDFMIETGTSNAHLIEINPRTTQVGHLVLGPKQNLAAALYGAIAGKEAEQVPPVTANDTIALFPQEWKRNSASPYLLSAYHDVPWSEHQLLRACLSGVGTQAASRPRQPERTAVAPLGRASASVAKQSVSNPIGD